MADQELGLAQARRRASRHVLDWSNQPLPFKIYTTLDPIPLPRELPPSAAPALEAVAGRGGMGTGTRADR